MPKLKYVNISKTIRKEKLQQLLKSFEVIDRRGFSLEFLQSLLAMLYWSGLRTSEVIGGLPHKAVTEWEGIHYTPARPPIMREQMWKDSDAQVLFVRARALFCEIRRT